MRCRVRRAKLGRFGLLTVVAASVWALLAVGVAQAGTITVGSVLPPESTPIEFKEVQTFFNTALPEKGANLVSPVNGTIVRWRVQGAEGGPFYLRVLRPNGAGAYTGAGTSNPATPSGTGLQTFTANLPVHTGDLIGIDPTKGTDKIGVAEVPGSSYATIFPSPFDGATVPPRPPVAGREIELSAEVQPTPAITLVSPDFGPVTGGTGVTITGTNLNGASAVKFGTVPATSFTVESETQITAVAPPSVAVGSVDVSATTLAGTSPTTRSDEFFYQGCTVPKLKGKTLKQAKKAIGRGGCKLGKVTRHNGKPGKVLHQSPKPGKVLAPRTKVNLTVGK
jgi:PASTA domain/IPT/TIG domain